MHALLKIYYHIPLEIDQLGYFNYQNEQYYICYLENSLSFLNVYQCYRYLMQQSHLSGFVIIKNNQDNWFSENYVLLKYIPEIFSYHTYLENFLIPLSFSKMHISDIKKQWIHKMDVTFNQLQKYDDEARPLIYYYLAIAENSINVLNYILQIDTHASLPLGLSLTRPINNDVYELLNPCHYIISTRARHIMNLIESKMLTTRQLKDILDNHFYDVYEIIYIYAHALYPGYFMDCVLNHEDILPFYQNIQSEKKLLLNIYQTLAFYVSLPKINWINKDNML